MNVGSMDARALLVCQHCDLLLQESDLGQSAKAECVRCGAVLYRSQPFGLLLCLVFSITAAVLFVIANAFPIVTVSADGLHNSTTLIGAAGALIRDGIVSVALLVFTTAFLMPALQIVGLLYLTVPLSLGFLPPGLPLPFRLIHLVRPWAMIEVFMMGLLVTLTKLNALVTVAPGIALGAFALLMLALTAALANFDPHHVWKQVESLRQNRVAA